LLRDRPLNDECAKTLKPKTFFADQTQKAFDRKKKSEKGGKFADKFINRRENKIESMVVVLFELTKYEKILFCFLNFFLRAQKNFVFLGKILVWRFLELNIFGRIS